MFYFMKYFGIIICCVYSACVLSQMIMSNKKKIIIILYSVFMTLVILSLSHENKYIGMTVVLILTMALIFCITRVNSINIGLLACSLGYVSYFLTTLLFNFIILFIDESIRYDLGSVLRCLLQMIIVYKVVNNKRFKSSLKIINNNIYYVYMGIICTFILASSILFDEKSSDVLLLVLFVALIIFSILLFLYWRTSITRNYLERLSLRNIDSLNAELVEKTNYIKELEEDKARIEKLNHKNYKLVPAMEGAVMHYLDGVKNFVESNADNPAFAEFAAAKETDMAGFIDEGNRLLGELNKMLAEWEDIVHNDDIDGKKDLPVCGVTRVDYILSYMYERSLKENFVLKVDVDSELTGLTEMIITDEDLGTLIADLIENAIIATRHNNGKDILVRLGMMKKEYTIEVYDSGIPFDKEVLAKYGYEQITTHADESGSGIGMMQTYEILSKCGASLFIDEFAEGEGMYTKRISVVFNKKHQYVLYTKRSDEEVAYLKKRSDLMIVRK